MVNPAGDLSKCYLYRMTHIENIDHILKNGLTHNTSPNRNPTFVPIGDSSLINARNSYVLPNHRTLGDYIPFYFGARMPMLYVIQKGLNSVQSIAAEEIVYCITSVSDVINCQSVDYVFTNGHAVNALTDSFNPDSVD